MLRNPTNRTNNHCDSPSAAGTNPDGTACQHGSSYHGNQCSDGHGHDSKGCKVEKKKCDYQTCDSPPKPKPPNQNPQWLCYEGIREIVDWIRERTQIVPQIGIMSGRGLGGLADILDDKVVFKYKEIPHFHVSGLPDSPNQMSIGKVGRKRVVMMQGRFPPYEGFHYGVSSLPVRVMRMLGATHLINLHSVASLSADFVVGDFVLIRDHINLPGLCGLHPLKGFNDDRLGPRFPDLRNVYDKEMREVLKQTMQEMRGSGASKSSGSPPQMDIKCKDGVEVLMSGPAYLTPAEGAMLKMMGADVVGMSATHQNIAAVHQGMKVMTISLVSHKSPKSEDTPPEDEEANRAVSKEKAEMLVKVLEKFIKNLDLL